MIRTNDTSLSSELHIIRAHLLHYESLITDFSKSVVFIRDTPNPAMDTIQQDSSKKVNEKDLFKRECGNLMSEIERLERSREMQHKRLNNVINLVRHKTCACIVQIADSSSGF